MRSAVNGKVAGSSPARAVHFLNKGFLMANTFLTPNISLPDNHLASLIEYATESGISAEQLAGQIVNQWICTVLEPDRVRKNIRKTD